MPGKGAVGKKIRPMSQGRKEKEKVKDKHKSVDENVDNQLDVDSDQTEEIETNVNLEISDNTDSGDEPISTDKELGQNKNKQTSMTDFVVSKQNKGDTDKKLDLIASQLCQVTEKLNTMITKEYFDKRLENLVTTEMMSKVIELVKVEIKDHIKKDTQPIRKEIDVTKRELESTKLEVERLNGELHECRKDCDELSRKLKKMESKESENTDRLRTLEAAKESTRRDLNNLGQYTRKNSVRIYGMEDTNPQEDVEESVEKVVNLLNNKLQMSVTKEHISVAHRLGEFSDTANRPVLVHFVSRRYKFETIRNRRKLKNTPIVIKEDLTKENKDRLQKVSEIEEVQTAWSHDGKLFAKLQNDKVVRIYDNTVLSDLVELAYTSRPRQTYIGYGTNIRGRAQFYNRGYRGFRGGYGRRLERTDNNQDIGQTNMETNTETIRETNQENTNEADRPISDESSK